MTDGDPDTGGPVVVVGLGRTGRSVARFLHRRGVPVEVLDSRSRPAGLDGFRRDWPAIPVHVGGFDPDVLARAGTLVLSPGVAPQDAAFGPVRARGVPVIGDIELFAREAAAPIAAITGSNGKSTVTALLGEMAAAAGLDARIGGNIGTPALDLLDGDAPDCYVLELSSFQLDTTFSLRPRVATVLNVSPDHLDRYPDMAAYAAAKRRIFRNADRCVVNFDDPLVADMAAGCAHVAGFSLDPSSGREYRLVGHRDRTWLACAGAPLMPVGELGMAGRHNCANALAALAMGDALGLDRDAMRDALRRFPGLPHRCQVIARRRGMTWINDSKATNPGAAIAAVTGLDGPVILLAGGDAKGADFDGLATAIAGRVRKAFVFGRDAGRLARAFSGRVDTECVATLGEAVRAAAAAGRAGDTVLLSPACASLDQFAGFEQRGDAFVAHVEAL